jgi:hypothetical protein
MPQIKGFVSTNAMARMHKRLRQFALEFPQQASMAIQNAANETLVPILKAAMDNKERKFGNYSHNWQSRLKDSISATVVPNPKAPSIAVGFDMELPHTLNFLKGGMHRDWDDLEKMTAWIKAKDKIKNSWNARQRAQRIMKVLDELGAWSYHKKIMQPFSQFVRTGVPPDEFASIAAAYPRFQDAYRAYLYQYLEQINLNRATTDPGVPF